ncbi:pseudouridine synthase [Oculatella sp. LEGE 06141]|uniref:pseudouridine synthase n=1 Tax=Oculatella sp. LEGE 06141 TaxID=1828648 RepID=UPI00187F2C26|nr:pseudouridine synthase [Oculatella sp. LEGE 06141]
MPDQYLLFYKPYDVLTQFTDERSPSTASDGSSTRRTLKDYIPVTGVYPVGRLDRDSEGLLLLTNNGRVQHYLSDPKFEHSRTYWVQVERIPDDTALEQLRRGVIIQRYCTRPAIVRRLDQEPALPPRDPPIRFRKSVPTAWLELTLTEGKNRQVRRMTAAIGFPTLRLVRVAIAHLHLNGLEPGQWRELTRDEVEPLLQLGKPTLPRAAHLRRRKSGHLPR